MPIQQDRVIAIVAALRTTLDIWQNTIEAIASAESDAFRGRIAQGEALKQIRNVLESAQVPGDVYEILGAEEAHWRRFEHSNTMNRERMRRYRGKPTVLSAPRAYTSSKTGYDNHQPSAEQQREAARAYMQAQKTEPIVLPPEAELPPDFEERIAQAQREYDAEQNRKTKRFTRSDGVEVEVAAEEPPKPNAPLLE